MRINWLWLFDKILTAPRATMHDPCHSQWQTNPIFQEGSNLNENILAYQGANDSLTTNSMVISKLFDAPPGNWHSENYYTNYYSQILSTAEQNPVEYEGDPLSRVFIPFFDSLNEEKRKVSPRCTIWIHSIYY
jgi:hypothetical protein